MLECPERSSQSMPLKQYGDLADEFGGCFVALGFVVGEHFGAEGGASDVESDCYVGGVFVVKQGGEHGEEPVYGVGCLACAGGEFFGGEGVECAEGHGKIGRAHV